jgi:hypothetical protein
MIRLQPTAYSHVADLFDAYDFDRCLLHSVLDRHQDGHLLCDDAATPTADLFHPGRYGLSDGRSEPSARLVSGWDCGG